MYVSVVVLLRDEEFCNRLNNKAMFKGFTALHYAVLADSLQIVKLLLEYGANPCTESDSGSKPIDYAREGSYLATFLNERMSEVSTYKYYG